MNPHLPVNDLPAGPAEKRAASPGTLLSFPSFIIALRCQVVIAVLVLAGQRWLAVAAIGATAGCWIARFYLVPELLQVL